MHRGDLTAASAREAESRLGDATAGLRADLAYRESEIRGRHELARSQVHVAVGVETLGVLAHDHQVHRRAAPVLDALEAAARADIGEKIERDPQIAGGIAPALRARRVVEMRNGAEHEAVRRAAGLDDRVGQRAAVELQARVADFL